MLNKPLNNFFIRFNYIKFKVQKGFSILHLIMKHIHIPRWTRFVIFIVLSIIGVILYIHFNPPVKGY